MQKALTNLQENLNIPPDKWAKDINNSLKGKLRKLISRRKKKPTQLPLDINKM